jgi:site-specific recombinase XerD
MERNESIQAFEQYIRRRSPERRTVIDYVSDVRQFAAQCTKPWREVTMHDIDQFVDQQRQDGLSAATVKRRVAALKVFFDFLAEESDELAWPNPVRSKRHAGKQPKRLPRDLQDETIEQLWAVIAEPRNRAWFALMLRGGLRVGEIVSLTLADVLAAPQGEQPARLRVCGKGRKERLILLSADAYQVLDAWLQVRPDATDPHVFLNQRGRPLTENGVEWLLHRYGTQVGIQPTPHQLRHTYARQLTEAGMPISSLSKLLGHAQVTTTQIYTSGADPALAQAYQAAITRLSEPPATPPTAAPAVTAPILDLPATPPPPLPDLTAWLPALPADIRERCLAYLQHCLPTWSPQRRRQSAEQVLWALGHFWKWQLTQRPITQLSELSLADLRVYQQAESARGVANTTINRRLDYLRAVLRREADQDYPVAASIFRLHPLPRPDSLPRFLTERDYRRLEEHMRSRLDARHPVITLENACFFVLAHTGLRASECCDLQYQDLDLPGQRLIVRHGKGQRDRLVYLSDLTCQAIAHYLGGVRRPPAAPVFTRPNGQPIDYRWLNRHLGALGEILEITPLTCHRLRHTLATRLLNAGMDITRIQKLLGHEYLVTTQIYARIADTTVESDYRQAMHRIDREQMPLSDVPLPVAGWPAAHLTAQVPLDNSV